MKRKMMILSAVMVMAALAVSGQVKRIGIIGLDTSHSTAFAKVLNDETGKYPALAGFRVTAAYPFGSKTIESSYSRIPKFTEDIKKLGVEVVGSIAELLAQVDYVLLETNDGRLHLEQAAEVFKAGKPVFIDKPIAASLPDAIAILELAKKHNVPCFSSSSLRYTPETQDIRKNKFNDILTAFSYGPEKKEPTHMAYSWYGIHAVETLYTVMGTGCEEVTATVGENAEIVVGKWKGGRVGTFMGTMKGRSLYGGMAFTEKAGFPLGSKVDYSLLVGAIVEFFKSGVAPVAPEETIEVFTFMEAASQSAKKGGVPVSMAEVYKKGNAEAQKILKNY